MSGEFEVTESTVKVTGEAPLPEAVELEHGDELYVIGRVRIGEVSFPEVEHGVKRVHKARMSKMAVIDDVESAAALIAKAESARTGQGSIYDVPGTVPSGFVVNDEPVASMHNGHVDDLVPVPGDDDATDDF